MLQQGSTWRAVGTIAEGTVYQPIGTVLTAEASNVHEAYIVVADGKWVGFWLPVESAFVAATPPVAIDLIPEK